jgi:membrane protease YdiL (CAAX protease family)
LAPSGSGARPTSGGWPRPCSVWWSGGGLLSLGLIRPVINHLTGTTEDLSEYANLQGNLGMLAGLLLITWTVAALGEELAYRGFVQTRITDVLGANLVGVVVAVVFTSVLFGLAHTEYGIVGVAVTFLDALFLSVLRLRYRTLWASILAHGFWNTIGIVGFFLVGPINGFW